MLQRYGDNLKDRKTENYQAKTKLQQEQETDKTNLQDKHTPKQIPVDPRRKNTDSKQLNSDLRFLN